MNKKVLVAIRYLLVEVSFNVEMNEDEHCNLNSFSVNLIVVVIGLKDYHCSNLKVVLLVNDLLRWFGDLRIVNVVKLKNR